MAELKSKNGSVRIFANPIVFEDDRSKKLIIKTFDLQAVADNIKWITDNSKHYKYCYDAMGGIGVISFGGTFRYDFCNWRLSF